MPSTKRCPIPRVSTPTKVCVCVCYKVNSKRHRNRSAAREIARGHRKCVCLLQSKLQKASCVCVCVCVCACGFCFGLLSSCSISCLVRSELPGAAASGHGLGELAQRLDSSFVCAARVIVAPAVGAVLCCQ